MRDISARLFGQYVHKRFADIINPPPEETRTPEEVINLMKDKIRGLSEGGETPDGFV